MPGHRKTAEKDFRNAEKQTGHWKPAATKQGLADQCDLAQAKHNSSETVIVRH